MGFDPKRIESWLGQSRPMKTVVQQETGQVNASDGAESDGLGMGGGGNQGLPIGHRVLMIYLIYMPPFLDIV